MPAIPRPVDAVPLAAGNLINMMKQLGGLARIRAEGESLQYSTQGNLLSRIADLSIPYDELEERRKQEAQQVGDIDTQDMERLLPQIQEGIRPDTPALELSEPIPETPSLELSDPIPEQLPTVTTAQPSKGEGKDLLASIQQAKSSGQSFDEWVKGQGDVVYRGEYTRKQELNNSISTSLDKNVAKSFSESGKVSEMFVSREANIIDISDIRKEILGVEKLPNPSTLTKTQFESITGNKLIDYAKSKGYDVIDYSKAGIKSSGIKVGKVLDEMEYQIINSKVLKTRSQLKAEWDKVEPPKGEGKVKRDK